MSVLFYTPERFDQAHFYVDSEARERFEERMRTEGAQYTVKPCEQMWIDGGGSVSLKEEKITLKAADLSVGFFAYQLPFIISALQGARLTSWGCFIFSGRWQKYVFAPNTREVLLSELHKLEQLDPDYALRAQEQAYQDSLAIHVVYLAQCACQSGRKYIDCHGKKA